MPGGQTAALGLKGRTLRKMRATAAGLAVGEWVGSGRSVRFVCPLRPAAEMCTRLGPLVMVHKETLSNTLAARSQIVV